MSTDLSNPINEFRSHIGLNPIWSMIGLVLLIMILTCCNINNQSGVDASSSSIAPDFKLELFSNANHIKGTNLHLSDLRGKPVVINFWYPSCPPCRLEMPDFEASYKLHKDDVEFIGVMSVHLDTVAEGQEFIDQFGITYAVGPDLDDIISEYEIIGFPQKFRIFLPGIRFELPRAGIIAIRFFILAVYFLFLYHNFPLNLQVHFLILVLTYHQRFFFDYEPFFFYRLYQILPYLVTQLNFS